MNLEQLTSTQLVYQLLLCLNIVEDVKRMFAACRRGDFVEHS
jgi:hypothetical protein